MRQKNGCQKCYDKREERVFVTPHHIARYLKKSKITLTTNRSQKMSKNDSFLCLNFLYKKSDYVGEIHVGLTYFLTVPCCGCANRPLSKLRVRQFSGLFWPSFRLIFWG